MTEREMIDRLCGQLNAAMYARAAVGGFDKAEALKVMADARALLSASIADTAGAKLSDEQIEQFFEVPGLNIHGSLEPREIGIFLQCCHDMLAAPPAPSVADTAGAKAVSEEDIRDLHEMARVCRLEPFSEAIKNLLATRKAPELSALFRDAIAWGRAYGNEIPANQWDEMRDAKVMQLIAAPPAPSVADAASNSKLLALHKELNKITWAGADEGWDKAIEAVRERIMEMVK